ncbi:SCO1664 family protein [Herbiconiux sp. P15]|uniref:SCO1664 family protein n=1 Tax=Herbiconiux liukaitaii TaxID=3342799 RepID=UPI0035BAD890
MTPPPADPPSTSDGSSSGTGTQPGELELVGRITTASNATFLARLDGTEVVYKPVRGESPLWDFPDGTLAGRETAAYLVSEALGWNVVPRTWLGDGPLGPGMLQLWQHTDEEQQAIDLVDADDVPETGWRPVFEGHDEEGRTVVLLHEDSPALRRMTVFDALVNNADRKGGHVLALPDGHRHGVDHGLTFHEEHKLRTVLWGWIGEPLEADELEGLERVRSALTGDLGAALAPHITDAELTALDARCARLLAEAVFPEPEGDMPAVPWPLF